MKWKMALNVMVDSHQTINSLSLSFTHYQFQKRSLLLIFEKSHKKCELEATKFVFVNNPFNDLDTQWKWLYLAEKFNCLLIENLIMQGKIIVKDY